MLCLAGCASPRPALPPPERPFAFERDTFAFANELKWEYTFDDRGGWSARRREPAPAYSLRCFVLARATREFQAHAHFDATLPATNAASYAERVDRIVGRDPKRISAPGERVVIPGFSDLRSFSVAYEDLLKARCGGAWQSYVQASHWRMIFPFSRKQQAATAEGLARVVRDGRTAVVHVVRFPSLAINHAVVLFGVEETRETMVFAMYDPNDPRRLLRLTFDRARRSFAFPQTHYFAGGFVNVNEVYRYEVPGPPPLLAPRQADCHRRKRQKNAPKKSRPQRFTPRM